MGHIEPVAANRWVAKEHIDDSTCQPCIDNDGRLYKNREDAYADYPDGKGYVNCVGAEYGNDCRGRVVKRHGGRAVTPEQIAAIEQMSKTARRFSARAFTDVQGPTEGIRVAMPVIAAGQTVNAQLYIYDYIGGYDGVSAMDVVNALDDVTGDVDVHINSGGGSIFEGAAIYTALDNYAGGTVRSYVDGVAASAASVIMMAGEEIIVEPAATVMVHAGSGGVWGTAKDMRAQADVLDMLTETMAGIYAARTGGVTAEWLDLLNSGDTWYNAQQAIDMKLATRLGGKSKAAPAPEQSIDILTAIGAAFGRPAEPIKPAKIQRHLAGDVVRAADRAPLPASVDIEGIRNALKGIMA